MDLRSGNLVFFALLLAAYQLSYLLGNNFYSTAPHISSWTSTDILVKAWSFTVLGESSKVLSKIERARDSRRIPLFAAPLVPLVRN